MPLISLLRPHTLDLASAVNDDDNNNRSNDTQQTTDRQTVSQALNTAIFEWLT